MARGATLVRALVATCLLWCATAAPALAAADDESSIAHVESSRKHGLQLLVNVPPDVSVDLSGVTVTVDGEPAEAQAAPADTVTTVARTAVLVIDTSNSMRGDRFRAARVAAQTFLSSLPSDVQVGIITFDGDVSADLPPTRDRDSALAVIDRLGLSPQTRLYDGVLAGARMAGNEGQRTLLVLSDGADTSDTALDEVTAAIAASGLIVDVVSLQQSGAARFALRQLAAAGNGQLIDAEPDALAAAFAREADILARQVVVTAEIPASVTQREASIVVSFPTDDGSTLTAEAFAPVSRAREEVPPTIPAPERPFAVPTIWMYAGMAAVGLGLLVMMVVVASPRSARELSPAERASAYTGRVVGRGGRGQAKAEAEPTLAQAKTAAESVLARNAGLAARIATRLEGAGNPLKPAEWLLVHTAIFAGAGVVGLMLGKGSLVVGLVFMALGAFGPWLFLGLKRSRRRKAFNSSLPDTLQLMSGSLAAGLSLAQSVDTIVREGVDPVASEFKRVLVETRLGVSLEDALEGVADRFESKDFGWVVMAIKIQRQVGGNLAELLDNVAATMREREYMRRQVAALAAEGKLSAYVLGGLPPGFMLYLLMTNRDYVIVMFTEPMGWAMLIGAGMLLSLGIFWMSRLIKVEV